MTDKPPAEVWLRVHDGNELWRWSPTEIWNSHRYVLAPEGSAVIPPEKVDHLLVLLDAEQDDWVVEEIAAILRAARGGAA